jgi:tetratricopeptide (TPR) repeat protein
LLEGNVCFHLGFLARLTGQVEEGRTHCRTALSLHRRIGNESAVGHILNMLGGLERMAGHAEEANTCFAEALSINRRWGNRRGELITFVEQAPLYQDHGQYGKAHRRFQEALTIARQLGEKRIEARVLNDLADIEMRQGNFVDAKLHFNDAMVLARAVGQPGRECTIMGNLGELLQREEQLDEAERHLERAIELAHRCSETHSVAVFSGTLALCRRAQREDFNDARELLRRSEAHLLDYPHELGIFLCKAVRVEQMAKNPDGARRLLIRAQELAAEKSIAPDTEFGRNLAALNTATTSRPVRIGPGASWFEVDGKRVDISRSEAQNNILALLSHSAGPHELEAVFAAGWPGQKARPDTAAHRVYSTISRLRNLGLKKHLHSRHDGYYLDPEAFELVDG